MPVLPAALRASLLLVALLLAPGAGAAGVADLYSARVPVAGTDQAAQDDAFGRALAEVLVKVTGRRDVAGSAGARALLARPAALVRQFQPVPGGLLRVTFDPAVLRSRLDAAGLPVWGDDRPLLLLLVPVGGPGGDRYLAEPEPGGESAAASPVSQGPVPVAEDPALVLRSALLADAAARGLPVVLPPADATVPVAGAAGAAALRARTGAAGVLAGEPVSSGGAALRRWTLQVGDERAEWQGDGADGINGAADRLATRYATAASSRRPMQLRVSGVAGFADYARVQAYLRGLALVEEAAVVRVAGDTVTYQLAVRGDPAQVRDAFALRGILVPADAGGGADLAYRLVPAP